MLLAPYRQWTITTRAPVEVVRARVRALMRDGLFTGETTAERTTLVRRIRYENSFLPAIDLSFDPLLEGTDIHLQVRVHWSVTLFMIVWIGFLGSMLGARVYSLLQGEVVERKLLWIPAGMLVYGYGLMMGGFLFEAQKARRLLTDRLAPPASPEERASATSASVVSPSYPKPGT